MMYPEKPPGGEVPQGFRLLVALVALAVLGHWAGFW